MLLRRAVVVLVAAALGVWVALAAAQGGFGGGSTGTTKCFHPGDTVDITIGGKNDKNPTPDTPDTVKEGMEHFGHHCQICHGLDGQNTGVPFAANDLR